jgi:hypothetical protein
VANAGLTRIITQEFAGSLIIEGSNPYHAEPSSNTSCMNLARLTGNY